MQGDDPWFVAKDVTDALGFRDANDGTKYLEDDEISTCPDNTSGQVRHIKLINESGLYSLILRSRKPEAKAFKKWVTAEVLPSIRKTGGYIVARPDESPEAILARAVLVAQDTLERMKAKAEALEAEKATAVQNVAPTSTLRGENPKPDL